MLTGLGVRLIGYDPAVHHTAPIWERLRIQPVACKHGQLWVGISRSALFDENALAAALCDGRIEA